MILLLILTTVFLFSCATHNPYQPFTIYEYPSTGTEKGYIPFKGCALDQCFITSKEDRYNQSHVAILQDTNGFESIPIKQPNQIWIYRTLESPVNTGDLGRLNGLINFTSTYQSDSDIPTPYGSIKESARKLPVHASPKKGRLVAWIASNCYTSNSREIYVKQLQNFIKVDTFGSCGDYFVSKFDASVLLEKYKFYLSFENSNCFEYITEKVWVNALRNNAIPIVMGARNSDYERLAPPNSFIHVEDFSSPKALAKYLKTVANNDTLYESYFEWKRKYYLTSVNYYCQLCEFLHKIPSNFSHVYEDMNKYWNRKDRCPNVVTIL